jgi:hypothetical protein
MILPALPFRVEVLKGFGFNLFITYLVWIAVILLLYPLCKKMMLINKPTKKNGG